MTHTPIQPYRTLTEFVIFHGLILPRPHATWRLLARPCVGAINGLDRTFGGLAVATNGVIVAMLSSSGAITFGHLQWFEKFDLNAESDLDHAIDAAQGRKSSLEKAVAKLTEEFEECF